MVDFQINNRNRYSDMAGVNINEHWTDRPKIRLEKELGKGMVQQFRF